MDLAINTQKIHHFDRHDLLQRLGWAHFFELRNRHEFSVSSAYEEIEVVSQALNVALDSLPRGYVFVGGSPGSGKSSLITRTFEKRNAKERWIRYYAFIPGSPEPGNVRGESENFLHDLTTALDDAGAIVGLSRSTFNRQQLLARLDSQLQVLGEHFQSRGLRSVILIDGLDHIPREQHPEVSLLKDLPRPERVPDGVLIVLGSQSDQLKDIPASVRTMITAESRRVQMVALSPQNVRAVLTRSTLPVALTDEQADSVFRISQGHPLALALLVNHLGDAKSNDDVGQILNATEPYAGDIDKIYQSHWDEISENSGLVYTLALLGRLRRHIDVAWMHTFTHHSVMSLLKTRLGHLFLKEADNRWFFFHNSFRLFIRRQTSQLVGANSDQNETEMHRVLAAECAKASTESPWSWEQLFHLSEAEKHQEVLSLASPEHFRKELLHYRPIEAISVDIRTAIKSAAALRDPIALIRLVLSGAEFAQREIGLSSKDVAYTLIRLGKVDLALEHLFDGRELSVSDTQALETSKTLEAIERDSEAARLFELAEPLDKSVKRDGIDGRTANESLKVWVESAIHFRTVETILKFIDTLEAEQSHFNEAAPEALTEALRTRLRFFLVRALRGEKRDGEAEAVQSTLNTDQHRVAWWFWLQVDRWRDALSTGDKAAAGALVRDTLAQIPLDQLDNYRRILAADGLFRAEGDSTEFTLLLATIS